MKKRVRKYPFGGTEAKTTRSSTYNKDNYSAFGDYGETAFKEGWHPISKGLQGSTTYVNNYTPFNDVINRLNPQKKDHFRLIGNKNGTFDVGLYDDTGNETQPLEKGVTYDFLSKRYFTGDDGILKSQQNSLKKMYGATDITDTKDIQVKMAAGGSVEDLQAQTQLGLYQNLGKAGTGILDIITQLVDGNKGYTKQPLVNNASMSNMVNPYNFAMGGDMSGFDEDQLQQLQDMADEQGITIEELIQQLQQGDDEQYQDIANEPDTTDTGEDNGFYAGDENNYATGGWIQKAVNPKHKGYCTPMTKSTCTPHRKALARTFKKHHGFHAYGGNSNSNIEVEGGEVVETPNGMVGKVRGAKHEDGGVNMNVPKGTKIFSDRLKVNGETMQKRKLKREARIKKLDKLLERDPTNLLIKNTHQRTLKFLNEEDNKDMMLQNFANKMYSPKQIMQGTDKDNEKYAYGGVPIGPSPYNDPDQLWRRQLHNNPGVVDLTYPSNLPSNLSETSGGLSISSDTNPISTTDSENNIGNFTAGDYIGMAGSLFNGIAPLINTKNAARNSRPNVNRYQGFGHEAIESNDAAQRLAATSEAEGNIDINTGANTAYSRNRNSARGINTMRALDAVTSIGTDTARLKNRSNATNQKIGLMGQRGQLTNLRDRMEAAGQTQADIENKADRDNYYSNMAQNLTNLGTSVEGIGRNFNTSKSNKVDANLISQLSQYGLEFDENGNLINKRKIAG